MNEHTTPVPTRWLEDLYEEFKRLGDSRRSMHMLQVVTIRDQIELLLNKDPEHTLNLVKFAQWMDDHDIVPADWDAESLAEKYLFSQLGNPSDTPTPPPAPDLPHSRACGIRQHEHGTDCHSKCPTCGGKPFYL